MIAPSDLVRFGSKAGIVQRSMFRQIIERLRHLIEIEGFAPLRISVPCPSGVLLEYPPADLPSADLYGGYSAKATCVFLRQGRTVVRRWCSPFHVVLIQPDKPFLTWHFQTDGFATGRDLYASVPQRPPQCVQVGASVRGLHQLPCAADPADRVACSPAICYSSYPGVSDFLLRSIRFEGKSCR